MAQMLLCHLSYWHKFILLTNYTDFKIWEAFYFSVLNILNMSHSNLLCSKLLSLLKTSITDLKLSQHEQLHSSIILENTSMCFNIQWTSPSWHYSSVLFWTGAQKPLRNYFVKVKKKKYFPCSVIYKINVCLHGNECCFSSPRG